MTADPDKSGVHIVWIEDSAHHFDLRSNNKDDPESVTKARTLEFNYINDYIKQYNDARDAKK